MSILFNLSIEVNSSDEQVIKDEIEKALNNALQSYKNGNESHYESSDHDETGKGFTILQFNTEMEGI